MDHSQHIRTCVALQQREITIAKFKNFDLQNTAYIRCPFYVINFCQRSKVIMFWAESKIRMAILL